MPRLLLPVASSPRLTTSRLRLRCALLQHLLPIVLYLGRLAQSLEVVSDPILSREVDHSRPVVVEVLHERGRIGLGVLENLEDVNALLGIEQGADLTRVES